ncbi:proteinase inhibitor I4 serpin [Desulfofarcimen acetoxidans DSM 771]|uniref:Proteinase inhibitor I4 serpin n=1 Tax=Desulfofarcimen acetoxidans (strain ATCC 49208 / DSM 771 / KCTC 5769 / VKM B-1644 / 5575) TaxID=485916 RepID=C8VZZ8_DESAS|nr:serpin family protein [Desulfofarcimen acetoxidans]ACV64966.1 proteinase inhibitor I4 serpin [Desulfofarcimen acetoxidans DSM 771]
MKRLIVMLLATVMLFGLTACSQPVKVTGTNLVAAPVYPKGIDFGDSDKQRELRENNPVNKDTVNAVNQFSYDTAAQLLKGSDTNGCYSPLSLYYALALAAAGAEDSTRDELLTLLGFEDADSLSKQCGNLYRLLYTDNKVSRLKIANSLWLADETDGQQISFKDSYIKNATEHFYTSIFTADFADENTGKAMGRWISENTNGTLAPEFKTNTEQIMSILNTVYFYDQWTDRFNAEKTKEDTFYLQSGPEVVCDFMNMNYWSHGFSKGNGYTRSSLGLKTSGSMIFILPDEGVAVADLLSSPQKLEKIFTQGEDKNGKVVWSVPKFKYGSSFDLVDTLKALGITSAFSLDSADFSALTNAPAFISGVKQETHISIDENGVEASAFTKIDYMGAAQPKDKAEMILNRPFIYGITAANGALLFVGICMNPAS